MADEETTQSNTQPQPEEETTDKVEPSETAGEGEPKETADEGEPKETADEGEPTETADEGEPRETADEGEPNETAGEWEPMGDAGESVTVLEETQEPVDIAATSMNDVSSIDELESHGQQQFRPDMIMEETQETSENVRKFSDMSDSQMPDSQADPKGKDTQETTIEDVKAVAPILEESTAAERKNLVNLEATATVKFVLMPTGQVVTMACMLGQTLEQLKSHFASELKMPVIMIQLMFDGKDMPEETMLADLGVGPNGTIQLEMQSSDPVNNPIRSYRPRQEYQMPDVITVRVITEDESKDVVVEIERATSKKPFLGGFRHKLTGVEFHNAAAQTNRKMRITTLERFCRDAQTVEQKHHFQQTFNDTSTQMTGIGVYVSNLTDKIIVPGRYILADVYMDNIIQKVIIIQKYYRRWLAVQFVNKLKEDKRRRLEWERQQELSKQKEKEDRIRLQFEKRMHPRSKEDFDLLYNALEKWRLEELERINSTLTGAERKAALCMLLDQETQLLAAIDRHKLETNVDNTNQRINEFLEMTSAPKKWRGFDGKFTEMATPYTLRAKELRDIYNSINMKYLTQDERLDVLLTLKHTVKEHDCKLTQEIIELIDREADLLMRGIKEGNLAGLRKRISTLFLQYIKTPTFNPEAARLLKVPQDPSTLRKNIYFCPSCNKYLLSTEFALSTNSRTVGKCHTCEKLDNDARIRQDLSHYRRMLRALRRSEEAFNDGSQIAFLIQENDLRYMVENIWNSQSVLSAWEDLYDLVLVRWDTHTEWSPWNCIFLTQDEAKAHDKLTSLEEGYGDVFIRKIKQKHTLARNYFSRLPGMAELIRKQKMDNAQSMAPGPSSLTGHAMTSQPQKV